MIVTARIHSPGRLFDANGVELPMINTADTDIVESLRWVAKSAKPTDAGQMRAAADEIEHLRAERRWIPVEERLPEIDQNVLACRSGEVGISHRYVDGWYWDVDEWHKPFTPSHWMPLPEPPGE